MKAVTIHVDEPTYRDFQEQARQKNRPASELIRRAMEEYRKRHFQGRTSLVSPPPPASVGEALKPWGNRAEMLETFLDRNH